MFGFGKEETKYVKLTEKDIKELEKNMSRSERKEFRRRLEQEHADREWDLLCMMEMLDD